jgi:NAD-dependent deacetylase
LSVFPAADFPVRAKQNGASLVIVNRDPTEIDELADLVIHSSIGATLSTAIAEEEN